MQRILLLLLIGFSFLGLFFCAQEEPGGKKVLARINGYELTLEEFQNQLAEELELERDFKLTRQAKKDFLEELIRKELLIQEAKRLKLDRKEKFLKAIERHWESVLIRDLMEMKSQEESKRILVSQEEIESFYQEMMGSEPPVSLDEIRDSLIRDIRQKKCSQVLSQWICELEAGAKIERNENLLYSD
jgi:hypothetical protein